MFRNIVGHKNIISFLEKSLKNGEIAHAYLFYGPKHLGKRKVAENFAEYILGQSINNHPDFYLVERERNVKEDSLAKNISIGQIRELERKLSLSSFLNSYKIAIIEEAETLSIEAANSLLKTLEEPTPKTVIILLTSRLDSLPPTIVSRCQVLKFLPVAQNQIYDYLITLGASRDQAFNLASVSWGKPGLAINFWKSQTERERGTSSSFSNFDNFKDYEGKVKNLICLMRAETFTEKTMIVSDFFKEEQDREDFINFLNQILLIWSSLLRDLVLMNNGCQELIFNSAFHGDLRKLAVRFDDKLLPKLYQEVRRASQYLKENFNPRLVMENLVLSF